MVHALQVMEIRPSIQWNKGHALEYLLDTLGFTNSNEVLPLYIGDDRTDEDAFMVITNYTIPNFKFSFLLYACTIV